MVALQRAVQICKSPNILSIDLPPEDEYRIRNLVSRASYRPTTRRFSLKLDRDVECESTLEREASRLLDACPSVFFFGEQALRIHYQCDHGRSFHIPDFAVLTREGKELVEVKFAKDVNREVLQRTELLRTHLLPLGFRYRLVTEAEIRIGSALSNAASLLQRGRVLPSDIWLHMLGNAVRTRTRIPLASFGWNTPGNTEAAWIARAILDGHVEIDLKSPITCNSAVFPPSTFEQENNIWPMVAL